MFVPGSLLEGQAHDAGAFTKGSAPVAVLGRSGDFRNLETMIAHVYLDQPGCGSRASFTSSQAVQILKHC